MREKINRLARGVLNEEQPVLSVSPERIDMARVERLAKARKPRLIIYSPVRVLGNNTIVTDGAETEFLNAGDYNVVPAFTPEQVPAFGNPVAGEMPADPWADRRIGNAHGDQGISNALTNHERLSNEVYNLQGQRVDPTHKGIVVSNGQKRVNQ